MRPVRFATSVAAASALDADKYRVRHYPTTRPSRIVLAADLADQGATRFVHSSFVPPDPDVATTVEGWCPDQVRRPNHGRYDAAADSVRSVAYLALGRSRHPLTAERRGGRASSFRFFFFFVRTRARTAALLCRAVVGGPAKRTSRTLGGLVPRIFYPPCGNGDGCDRTERTAAVFIESRFLGLYKSRA